MAALSGGSNEGWVDTQNHSDRLLLEVAGGGSESARRGASLSAT